MNIKIMLLSIVFITYIPNMLKAGKVIGTIKNAFSEVLRLRFGREKTGGLFVLYPMKANAMNARLNEIKREIVDNGVS
jgi:competence protein ComGC